MKKTLAVLVLAALAPLASIPAASARTVIIEHGHHHPHFFHRHHDRTVIIHRH